MTLSASVYLSRAYATAVHRHLQGQTPPTYRPVHGGAPCEECGAAQHEAHSTGAPMPRRGLARERRTVDDPTRALLLCRPHALLWRERDLEDGAHRRRTR